MINNEKTDLYRTMVRIRLFEEKISEYKYRGLVPGPVHTCIGQEAVSAGICSALDKDDYIVGNHRSHGHIIARGADLKKLVRQIFFGEGSMHVNDPSIGFLLSTAIVGSGLSVACGMAFASKFKKDERIICVFLGDGAINEGTFHECLNISSMWGLPVLFVVENNHVAVTTINKHSFDMGKLVSAYNIGYCMVNGQSVLEVQKAAIDAVKSARNNRPFLIEAVTHRFREHQEGRAYDLMKSSGYRNEDTVQFIKNNFDPIGYDYDTDVISQEKEIIENAFKILGQ